MLFIFPDIFIIADKIERSSFIMNLFAKLDNHERGSMNKSKRRSACVYTKLCKRQSKEKVEAKKLPPVNYVTVGGAFFYSGIVLYANFLIISICAGYFGKRSSCVNNSKS